MPDYRLLLFQVRDHLFDGERVTQNQVPQTGTRTVWICRAARCLRLNNRY
jgi:hypothetical protein